MARCLPSAIKPAETMPICGATLKMRRLDPGTSNLDCTSFSTATTTPVLVLMAIAVPAFSAALAAYSICQVEGSANAFAGRSSDDCQLEERSHVERGQASRPFIRSGQSLSQNLLDRLRCWASPLWNSPERSAHQASTCSPRGRNRFPAKPFLIAQVC